VQYSRKVVMPWRSLLPAAGAGLVGSVFGAWVVTQVDPSLFRKALPILLAALLIYTLAKKDMGRQHAPRFAGPQEAWIASGIGLTIGFYDGFFGPGTGSFLVFAYVRLLGYDFAYQGHVWWHLALAMAVANIIGSLIGTRLALKHGAGFVRQAFIFVVLALICKTAYDTWLR
jgi:uncharacterized membrane protein YfcA